MVEVVSIDWIRVSPSRRRDRMYDVYWGVSPIPGVTDFSPYFNIEMSENESGPWIPQADQAFRGNYASGAGDARQGHARKYYVRLTVHRDPDGPAVQVSEPYYPMHDIPRSDLLQYREMVRRENLALDTISGFPAFILKRIKSGLPCPDCTDEVLGDDSGPSKTTNCPKCFGTGTYGGYYRPYFVKADWGGPPAGTGTQKRGEDGYEEVEKMMVRIPAVPLVATDDILVDGGTGNRFIIKEVRPVLWKIFPTAQDVILSWLPKSNPAYAVPVKPVCDNG